MNQKLWSGLATATLLVTTLGVPLSSYANQTGSADEGVEVPVSDEEPSRQLTSTSPPPAPLAEQTQSQSEESPSQPRDIASQSEEAVKVGEYQFQEQTESDRSITEIVPHESNGRQAATLYVRDIPILTFLGAEASTATSPPPAPSASSSSAAELVSPSTADSEIKVADTQQLDGTQLINLPSHSSTSPPIPESSGRAGTENAETDPDAPVWRATELAAHLNQLYRDNLDANQISARWDAERQRYLIMAGDTELVEINADTLLPNTTRDLSRDTLQVANLLRRQFGDAPPLQSVEGEEATTQISLGAFQIALSGFASWYGPGFDGNPSASGEIFDQHDLTAAHRTLPFGTLVRVTNLDNGLSVVVRINDRGPFHGDRVIDLSTAAAQVIGLVQAGVAPVNLEVMNATRTAANSTEN